MQTTHHYQDFLAILKEELVPAMGCTEPIALAFAAAKAREVLGDFPDHVIAKCSGNIIKNVKCVTIPNTDDLVGIEASVVMGIVAGDASKEMEVLSSATPKQLTKVKQLLSEDFCKVELLESPLQLHIQLEVFKDDQQVMLEIKHSHIHITQIIKNGELLYSGEDSDVKYLGTFTDRSILSLKAIKAFADTVNLEDVAPLMDLQIAYNMAIAKEGLKGDYGLGIGKVILESYSRGIVTDIKAYTSAASEARMSGCVLPVIINSGSGNQGLTSSIPVVVYAKEKGISKEKLYRALVFSNLLTIHQKTFIGRLSAFCGAVSASCASGAAITYLERGSMEQIQKTIVNTLANISGIICDGAKASCASKIASSLDAAMMAHYLAMQNKAYAPFTGIVQDGIEETISCVGYIGKEGMKQTDLEILKIMIS